MMFLVIKGSPSQAISALLDHAEGDGMFELLSAEGPEELYLSPNGGRGCVVHTGSCTLRASLSHLEAARWFAEAPFEPPFPPGTLLWYRPEGEAS